MVKTYIFGASDYGKRAYQNLKERYKIVGFLDNDSKKWNTSIIDGIVALSPQILHDRPGKVIIASAYANEIVKQLQEMAVTDFLIFPSLQLSNEEYYKEMCLIQKIDRAALDVYKKLRKLEIESLDISEYSQNYLRTKSLTSLFNYSRIMYHILEYHPNINSILDYGGGTGILSILALELGVKEVYFNDIYDISCSDAEKIAGAMGYERKAYIKGDSEDIESYCKENNIVFDGIVSYDVIEHIYDLRKCFKELKGCLAHRGMICMETGANSFNQKFIEDIAGTHLRVEFVERVEKFGHKKRDSLRAYFDIRREFIEGYLEEIRRELEETEIIALSFLTRGQNIEDIKKSVNVYLESGILPTEDKFFRYNTCDPYTGNWAEHVIHFEEIVKYMKEIGFQTSLLFEGKRENSSLCRLIAIREW